MSTSQSASRLEEELELPLHHAATVLSFPCAFFSPAMNMTTSYIHDSVHSWMVAGTPYLK
jgi:hypothetical protein